ncbi:T6SS phospholipase effector Tle1-like catalytic domain-containing protein [Rhizobium panacihumi]|uniref:T6SS phospholipase effector Tle1-like catalytic domain-containing protein n=1 Tax=Rhizobium panacihumi TaxID=2008450 RepID=UPI003D7B33B0
MSKNIVILLDGTSNEIAANRSNILRLFGTLERSERQMVYYDPGVGTFGADENWWSFRRDAAEIWGLATGWGLDHNVKQAYRFLVENYQAGPREDGRHFDRDRIYLFGFSRGAYTARVLAGFIHAFGLMSASHLNLLDYAYGAYKDIPDQSSTRTSADASPFATMRLYERTLDNDRPAIRLLGLFDTVASMIENGNGRLQLKTHPFTQKNPSVEWVRHAVAIDERRTMFRPELWVPDQDYRGNPFAPVQGKQNAKEVWFAGYHRDVGGGFPEKDSAQIKIPLSWMIRETRPSGLFYKDHTIDRIVFGENTADYVQPDALAPLHDSMNAGWTLLEWLPRKVPKNSWRKPAATGGYYIPRSDPRLIPANALLHETVQARIDGGGYNPPNLPAGAEFVF